MDVMELRRGLLMGMANNKILARGTYIQTVDGPYFDIDTGVTGWKYFLISPRVLPYSEAYVRCFGLMFISIDANYALFSFGPSSNNSVPNITTISNGGQLYTVDGSVVKKRGIGAQTGTLKANIEYDWFCWN